MIINFTNYYDQTQAIGFQSILLYSGIYTFVETPYPLLLTLTKSVEFGISLSNSVEFGITTGKETKYNISLSKTGGGGT